MVLDHLTAGATLYHMADTATHAATLKTAQRRHGRGHGGAAMRRTAAELRRKGYTSAQIRAYFHKHGHPHKS